MILTEWLQFVICPINQIEDGVTTRKNDTTHFIYRAGFISDESVVYVFFRGPHRTDSVFLWIYIFGRRAFHLNLLQLFIFIVLICLLFEKWKEND